MAQNVFEDNQSETGGKARNLNKQKPVSCEKQGEKKKAKESVPHLQIPKPLWKDEPQRGPTPDPLTPFSPVSTEPPPVVGTHPRRAPNTLSCAPVVPSHSHVVNLPMAVDAGGPLQAVEPSFPGTSRSSAHTTPPEACTATPVSPENAGHLGTNNHKANGGIAGNEFPVGGYPQDAAGTVNTARSQTGPVNSIDGAVGWPGDRSCSEDCEISMDIDDEELEAQIRSEVRWGLRGCKVRGTVWQLLTTHDLVLGMWFCSILYVAHCLLSWRVQSLLFPELNTLMTMTVLGIALPCYSLVVQKCLWRLEMNACTLFLFISVAGDSSEHQNWPCTGS